MKAKDIRSLTTDQMLEKEKQYKEELFNLRAGDEVIFISGEEKKNDFLKPYKTNMVDCNYTIIIRFLFKSKNNS